ncbi:PHP domain-containing protein [Gordonia sp. (in: high G+C Gram-positive bacteria)]|uniref:PHP domain-containing protein n=1 Tax=Gordonia sp. (in: high G+C Gram-positive bacteria) TaxID=84139 RepID=UPI003C75833A
MANTMTADLHTHSNFSDGTDTPEKLIDAAVAAGLTTIALTDHDTANGWDEIAKHIPAGMRVLPGAEFSTKHPDENGELVSVHLLGYLFDRDNPAIVAEWKRMHDERAQRGARIVGKLIDGGFPITLERVEEIAGSANIGRPHIGKALVEVKAVKDVGEAFVDLLHDGSPYYVPLQSTSLAGGIKLINDAGGVAVIAHPRAREAAAVLTEDVLASLVPLGLAGLEVNHYGHDADARAELSDIATRLGLLQTGSSDYHGTNKKDVHIGMNCTPDDVVEEIIARGAIAPFGPAQ